MSRKLSLLLFFSLFLLFTVGSIHAGDVNVTDSDALTLSDNATLPVGEIEDSDNSNNMSFSIEETPLKDPKHQTEITSNIDEVYYKGYYSVTLSDSDSGQPIPNKKVNFIINGVNYAANSDGKGLASVAISLNPGKYSITSYFDGDDSYLPSNNFTSTLQVLSTVKAVDMTKYYKGAKKYTATFYDSHGNARANRNVVINVNGKSYTKKTNGNGVASLSINLKPGTYRITASDPVTGYKVTTTFKILSTISSSNVKKVKGDSRKFVAKFFKSNGKLLAKKYIKYKLKGKIHKVKTSSKGNLVLSFKKFKKGTYKIVLYNKDGLSKRFTVKIYGYAKTKLSTSFYTFTSGDEKVIKVKLTTGLGGNSNVGKIVKVRINGNTYSKKTDSNGEVSLDVSSLDKGVYTFKCSYAGNKYFKSSKTSDLVTILENTTPQLTVVSTTEFGSGAGTPFRVALTAGDVPLAKRTMTFKIAGNTYTAITDNYGIASIPINLGIGNYLIEYETYGQYKVSGTSGSCNITVFKRTATHLSWECGYSYKDSSQSFKFLLKDSDGNPVPDEAVELSIDGKTYTVMTNSDGYAKIKTGVAFGKYKVSVKFKDTNYYVGSKVSHTVKVSLSKFKNGINEKNKISSLKKYLKSSKNSPAYSKKIKSLVKKLTKHLKTRTDKAKALFRYVKDKVRYSYYYDTKLGAVGALKAKRGNCVDQAHLLIAMYRAAGFKARYVHGSCSFSDGRYGHVWTQVLIGKNWVVGDPINKINDLGKIKNWNSNSHKVHNKYRSLPF